MRDPAAADPVPSAAGPTRSAPPATPPSATRCVASLAAALATPEVRRLVAALRGDLAGLRDQALLPLLGYAEALRRSELAAVEREHLRFTADGLELLLLAATAAAAAWCRAAPPGYRDAAPVPALAG